MKVLIVGAGLIGTTSAYVLNRRGHEVIVLEREGGPARQTSFANGSLLTPCMPEPWNAPGCWRTLLSSLGRSDSPMQLRLRALPGLTSWGLAFLRNSTSARYHRHTLHNLRLALYSLQVMHSIQEHTPIQYGGMTRGTLRLFRDRASFDRALGNSALASEGVALRGLSIEETLALEPALRPIAGTLAGAIHYPIDESGDAHRFCRALAERAAQSGVQFRFDTQVSSLEMQGGRVRAIVAGAERLEADRYLIAAASDSTLLLGAAGLRLPVQPVKGYSITLDRPPGSESLRVPIVDDDLHAVVVPLEGALRVAGTAEFTGFDRTLNARRIEMLLRLLRQLLPQLRFEPAAVKSWCGLRPMCADGIPIIGPTALANLYVNTGHGHLGWTMAAGSAQLLADLMEGRAPAIDAAPYDLKRFG